ncbi:Ig-like domain-containing protein [Deinococcus pimensis]|uniref:Ig-like domain-containing protein n=1 Tax=Deinococcus pimensis TaxID=309888 RepID=UPI0004BCAD66|nr:Ig-like domain-containing protein [Deinococcus pimensis]
MTRLTSRTIRSTLGFGLTALLLAACTGGPTGPTPPDGGGTTPPPDTNVLARVNFQDKNVTAPEGYAADTGAAYDAARGYGWVRQDSLNGTHVPLDMSAWTRTRDVQGIDVGTRTLMHMQPAGAPAGAWEYNLPSGKYAVTVSVGDALYTDSVHQVRIEGTAAFGAPFEPIDARKFNVVTRVVDVTDGRLTLDAVGGTNTKLNYVVVRPADRPTIRSVSPQNYELNVNPTGAVKAELNLTASGVAGSSLSAGARLTEQATGAVVSADVRTSGGGDTVVLQPKAALKANTAYVFEVTSDLKDQSGNSFRPWRSTFTTGSATTTGGPVAFEQVALPTAGGKEQGTKGYSAVEIGPDGKLYAANFDGEIRRFGINPDGTLTQPQVITSVRQANGNQTRWILGMKFDPKSTADNLVLYVTNNADWPYPTPPADWTGKITKLSGPNLENVQDLVVGLPRSNQDHATNSLTFKPGDDTTLYVLQGSMSSLGAPDTAWGMRSEHLLSAALLKVDLTKIGASPVNVQTEGGPNYNPFAPGAPVTLYASGIRNAYDMVWHSNGRLYVPTNGSAAGGNAPATPSSLPASCATVRSDKRSSVPSVPAINSAGVQHDYLFKVEPGGYYGHPNPARCEYAAFGGNPTAGVDPMEMPEYPVGTAADPNWRGFAYDFGEHASPNGVIEEYTMAGNSALKNKLLVVRYSAGADIIVLTPGADGNIVSAQTGITGLTNFSSQPLDLVENRANGFIYVAQLDQQTREGTITLLRPK